MRALEEIYLRFKDRVYGLAWKMTGDSQEAEDLTHDVFLRIHDHLDSFEGRSELGTWIYRVATNLCLNHLRRRKRASFFEAIEERFGLTDRSRSQESAAIQAEATEMLQGAIRTLPPVYRACVVLRDLEGLSYQEMAEVLGVPEGTVMSRLARGRDRLRQALARANQGKGTFF